jgi:hypothetical protein
MLSLASLCICIYFVLQSICRSVARPMWPSGTSWRFLFNAKRFALWAVILGALCIGLRDFVEPYPGLPSSAMWALTYIGLFYLLVLTISLAGSVVLSFLRRWNLSAQCFLSAVILWAAMLISTEIANRALRNVDQPHKRIAEIYASAPSAFSLTNSSPELFDLGLRCDPPLGAPCNCWLLRDPNHASGVEVEKSEWHEPSLSIFLRKDFPIGLVSVQRINAEAYSVLTCDEDWRGWLEILQTKL